MPINYTLLAEYCALIVTTIILISFLRDYEPNSLKYRLLKLMYYGTLGNIVVTIASHYSVLTTPNIYPIWFIELINTLYFVLSPIASFFCFLYALAVSDLLYSKQRISKRLFLVSVPFLAYVIIIFSNYFHHKIFTISPLGTYIRGDWYQITYIVAAFNLIATLVVAIITMRTRFKGIMLVLTLNLFLVAALSAVQFFIPSIYMSGIASVSGILVVHLYIQNVNKSTDHLTNLHNRMALMHKLNENCKKNERFSFYVFSLRNFKNLNERYGLEIGDTVLKLVAGRFSDLFSYNSIFRYGGDEFGLVVKSVDGRLIKRIEDFVSDFSRPFFIDGYEISVDVVYTRVDFPDFGLNAKELISSADYSVRVLKEGDSKKNFLFDTTITKKMNNYHSMVQRIKQALDLRLFEVYYQPIYSIKDKSFTQAEALVRMKGPCGKLIFPGEFIEIAEKTGLIVNLTYIVLDIVCRDLKRLMIKHGDKMPLSSVSVNFPFLQFSQPNLVELVSKILAIHKIPTSMIKIEITERSLIEDTALSSQTISKLSELGFEFEIDDFGVDYSNMSVFLDLPVNIIKIDKSLLTSVFRTAKNKLFFKNFVKGIKSVDKIIIAEGVEQFDELDFITQCDCDYVQGYVFSKALDIDDFEKFIIENNKN